MVMANVATFNDALEQPLLSLQESADKHVSNLIGKQKANLINWAY